MTLGALVLIGGLNQSVHTGGRVAVALTAIALDASPFVIGTITALYGLLAMPFAVWAGRLSDLIGARVPVFAGTVLFVLGALVPAWHPGLASLYVAAALIGLGNMTFQVSIQNAVGLIGRPEDRTRNFSWLAMGISGGAIVGPLMAGYAIDYAGFEPAFVFLALCPVISLVMLVTLPLELPGPRPTRGTGRRRIMDLLGNRGLRAVFLVTALQVISWELFTFLTPIHGSNAGLSASAIGVVMGAFSAASFLIRLVLPAVARHFTEWQMLKAAIGAAAVVFVVMPLATSAPVLVVLAFLIGIALGSTQPLVMTLMHEAAPPGRAGEAAGIRGTVVMAAQAALPLLFGGVGTALGMIPVFWTVAAVLLAATTVTRRNGV